MIRRARFLSGVVLLTTLLVSFVEGVAAAACGPAMPSSLPDGDASIGMGPMDMGSTDMRSMSMDMTEVDHECPPVHGNDADDPDGAPSCPFTTPGAAAGCAYSASLPSDTAGLRPLASDGDRVAGRLEERPVFLRIASIFRPPIA